jgi:hypothetical protein
VPPDDIRIPDLASPLLSEVQQLAVDYMESQPVELRAEVAIDAACAATGLQDFGNDDFRARLSVWLESVDEDMGLNGFGRRVIFNNCVRYLSNRLLFEDLLERHPEILDVEIRRPIIVIGLPRSGTTHLVNLIAADQRLRSLPYWESAEPIPRRGEGAGADGLDPRYLRCRKASEQSDQVMPLLRAMHHMTPEHVHEEIEVQNLDFGSYDLEWNARVPRWRDYQQTCDLTSSYEYMKNVLKALQWMRGPERWILKSPQHLEQIRPLMSVFPDATVAITHRDPVSVIQSAITMLAYGDRCRRYEIDAPGLAEYWIDRVERLLRACVRDRECIPAGQSIDVLFHEFMADDVAMVEHIYKLADLEMTDVARGRLNDYLDSNRRGKHGRVVYDLEGDFGVNASEVRERFDFYFDRFPVRKENA